MGLLSRVMGAARRGGMAGGDTLGVMGVNGLIGAGLGAGYDGKIGEDGVGDGALAGGALGAGLGALGGARGIGRAVMRGWQEGGGIQAIKQEALQYVRNSPQATQAVMQAQTPQEIAQIVDAVITRSRSRITEGGF